MSKIQLLRMLINQRLTAAADEIFGAVERTIAEYEEIVCLSNLEIDRQRKMLNMVLNPQIQLLQSDPEQPSLSVCKNEVPEQHHTAKERSPGVDQGDPLPPYIKEEPENESEPCKVEEPDDEWYSDYVPALDTNAEDDPINSFETSDYSEAEESQMNITQELDITVDINGASANSTWKDEMSDTVGRGLNFCFICEKAFFRIARHFKCHISENADVAKVFSLPSGSRSRRQLLEKLRNRGNFKHNSEVLKKGRGSLKVKRRAKGEYKKYEYCIHCRALFLQSDLWRHMRRCSSKPESHEEHQGRNRVRDNKTFHLV